MPDTEQGEHTTAGRDIITLPYGQMTIMFAVMLLGLLLVVIGLDRDNSIVYYIGAFFLPASLLWGGLFLKEEDIKIRITMLAVGGFLIATLVAGMQPLLGSLSALLDKTPI